MIPPEDIQRVRKLTDEEEQLLRDHVGLGAGGKVGWYLVPDGVEHQDREAFFDKFLRGSSASDDERKKLLIKGYVDLHEARLVKTVTHVPSREKLQLALPKAAAVLADIALSKTLQWEGSPDADETFPEPLRWGLPLCVVERLDAARRVMPPDPETSKKGKGKKKAEAGGSGAAAKPGASASSSRANAGGRKQAARQTAIVPTASAHDSALSAQLEKLQADFQRALKEKDEALKECQAKYTADMRRVFHKFEQNEKAIRLAKKLLSGNRETKQFVDSVESVNFPFDKRRRPFRDGSANKAARLSNRPEPFAFAYALEADDSDSE